MFVADPHWGAARYSVSLQAEFPDTARAALDAARQQLMAQMPAVRFRRADAAALHVTVHLFLDARQDFDKEDFWQQAGPQALAVLDQALAAPFAPFDWTFTQLAAAPLGVIALAGSDPRVLALRQRLRRDAPHPPGMDAPYAQVHCTLLRYADTESLPPDFAARVAMQPLHVPARIGRLHLLCNRRYPSLDPEILRRFDLEEA